MAWTREQTSVLLELYKEQPLLYEIRHPLYYTKPARKEALEKMSVEMEKFRPGTTVEIIKIKLNTLRTQFTKELTNFRKSQNNPDAKPYRISLWCFEKMMFLHDCIGSKKSWTKSPYLQENYSEENVNHPFPYKAEDPLDIEAHTESKHFVSTLDSLENETTKPTLQSTTEWIQVQNAEAANIIQSLENNKRSSPVSEQSDENDKINSKKKKTISLDEAPVACNKEATSTVKTKNESQEIMDEWELLGRFVTTEIKNLKSDTRRRKLKRRIIQLIFKDQEEEEAELNELT